MTPAECLVQFARTQLQDLLHLSGRILYSSHETLKPGKIYLLGHNPGGDPVEQAAFTIGRDLDELPSRTTNAYEDERWRGGYPKGGKPLQKRVCWMLDQLGEKPAEVAASNFLFNRSRDSGTSKFREHVDRYWTVHEKILDIVKPRLILTFSGPGYAFLRRKLTGGPEVGCLAGHGNWKCHKFQVSSGMWVANVPHLSRYDITGKNSVIDWMACCLSG